MSIHHFELGAPRNTIETAFHPRKYECCFVCGNELTSPAVCWAGFAQLGSDQGGTIWLHPECVVKLAYATLRDVDEINNPHSGQGGPA